MDLDFLIKTCCEEFGITEEAFNSKSRKREIVDAVSFAVFLYKEAKPTITLFKLGKLFADRHHANILYLINRTKNLIEIDRDFNNKYLTIKNKLDYEFTIRSLHQARNYRENRNNIAEKRGKRYRDYHFDLRRNKRVRAKC